MGSTEVDFILSRPEQIHALALISSPRLEHFLITQPNEFCQAITLLAYVWEVHTLFQSWQAHRLSLQTLFFGFYPSLQKDAGILSHIKLGPLPYTGCPTS